MSCVGFPDLTLLPGEQMLAILGYAMFCCLVVNDSVKVEMIRRCVPTAANQPHNESS